jgi:hypothetical protein
VTAGDYLRVVLRVANEGVDRAVEPGGWATGRAADARLTDPAGRVLKPAAFEPGWGPADRSPTTVLFPGKAAEILLIFEAPPERATSWRLELPGSAVGLEAPARFLIPGSFVTRRRTP